MSSVLQCLFQQTLIILFFVSTGKVSDGASESLYQIVEAIEGRSADLPCSLDDKEDGDSVYLVLWYRRDGRTPIYSYDSRLTNQNSAQPEMWSEPSVFGERAIFHPNFETSSISGRQISRGQAFLRVHNVSKDKDEGDYTCRVDFRQSPTKYHRIRLKIIVEPAQPVIRDFRGQPVSGNVGPYQQGDVIILDCAVYGGIPQPKVIWYRDDTPLDSTDQKTDDETVVNRLAIDIFHRKYLDSRYRCLAVNNNLSLPVEASVKINFIFPPLGVKISSDVKPFSAGRSYTVRCITWGSNPPADLSWQLITPQGSANTVSSSRADDKEALTVFNTTDNWNTTRSSALYRPKSQDQGGLLLCSAINPHMPGLQPVEDQLKLEINYPPVVKLEVGKALNLLDLEQGDDVYFECNVLSNPPPYKVRWIHNDKEIALKSSGNIIMSNQSLVLQKVRREQSGKYRCEASNVEGDGISQPVNLAVMFTPVCAEKMERVYGVTENETIQVECKVESHPPAKTYLWSFNNSVTSTMLPQTSYSQGVGRSVLTFTPRSHMEFGTLLCWAANAVGGHHAAAPAQPCIFHVIPTGPPEVPTECRQSANHSETAVIVECRLGYSGGLPQQLHMEVFMASTGKLLSNVTGLTRRKGFATVTANNLPSGGHFALVLYTMNQKGHSKGSINLEAFTLHKDAVGKIIKEPSQQNGLQDKFGDISGLTVIFAAVTITIVILIVGLFIGAAVRRRRRTQMDPDTKVLSASTNEADPSSRNMHQYQLHQAIRTANGSALERSPDIVRDAQGEGAENLNGNSHKVFQNNLSSVSTPPEGGFYTYTDGSQAFGQANADERLDEGYVGEQEDVAVGYYDHRDQVNCTEEEGFQPVAYGQPDYLLGGLSRQGLGRHEPADAATAAYLDWEAGNRHRYSVADNITMEPSANGTEQNNTGLNLGLPISYPHFNLITLRTPLLDDDRESCV